MACLGGHEIAPCHFQGSKTGYVQAQCSDPTSVSIWIRRTSPRVPAPRRRSDPSISLLSKLRTTSTSRNHGRRLTWVLSFLVYLLVGTVLEPIRTRLETPVVLKRF